MVYDFYGITDSWIPPPNNFIRISEGVVQAFFFQASLDDSNIQPKLRTTDTALVSSMLSVQMFVFFFFLIKKEVITHFIFLISSCLPAQAPLLHTKFDKVISLHDRSFSRACVTAAFLHLFIQFIHYCLILPLEFQEKEPGSDFCPPLYKQCPT